MSAIRERSPRRHARMSGRHSIGTAAELLAVVLCSAASVAITHDIPYVLAKSYWLDEAWVAVSARFPAEDVLSLSSSTPPLWSFAQRLFAPLGQQDARLLPLIFVVGMSVAAYYAAAAVTRQRGAGRVLVGGFASVGVLVLPMTLMRNDLKQYTADGCVALVLLYLCARAWESDWSARWLWGLACTGVVGFCFSIPSAFVFASLAVVWLVDVLLRRLWRPLLAGLIPFAAGCVGIGAVYVANYARDSSPTLVTYWAAYYPRLHDVPRFVIGQLRMNGPSLMLGHWWPTAFGVVFAAIVLAIRWKSPFGLLPIVLAPVMVGLGVEQLYPLLDTRTSYFLFVVATFFACTGIAAAVLSGCGWLLRRRERWAPAPAAVAVIGLVIPLVAWAAPQFRQHSIPPEDPRAQVSYIAAHYRRGDVILLNRAAGFGFAYYWAKDQPGWHPDASFANGFQMDYPAADRIIIATDDRPSWVTKAADQAAKSGGTLWVVRSHMGVAAAQAWAVAVPLRIASVGPEPLAYLPAAR